MVLPGNVLEQDMKFSRSPDLKAPRGNIFCCFFETKKKENSYGDSTQHLGET